MKNRTILGIICMLLAVAVCFGIAPLLNKSAELTIDAECSDCDIPQTVPANTAEDIFRSLDGSKQAISITLDGFAGGLSGKLTNGDIVSVIVTTDGRTLIPPELRFMRVITATSSRGVDADAMDGELPTTATLLVNEIQATMLARYELGGKLHLTLVYRGGGDNAARFLEAQEKVFLTVRTEDEDG
jgi:pilus assembly protein CpaB